MPYSCSKETLIARLFLGATKTLTLVFLFFFHLFSSVFWYDQDSDYDSLSDEEDKEPVVEEEEEDDDFVRHHSTDHVMSRVSSGEEKKKGIGEMKLSINDKFLIFAPSGVETVSEEGEWCTVGSSSKPSSSSSSRWRSSITYKEDSGPDLFSSSYSIFHELQYDKESTILFNTTESLKSFQVEPRSISQSFVSQLARSGSKGGNSYHELESGYVADVCLAWEILSWNYTSFRRKLRLLGQQGTTTTMSNSGFPAQLGQQFQQFQVLLRRYIENEPYEGGKRPEIYARTKRNVAPKLLLVPQILQDYEEDVVSPRISSTSFLDIIESSIRTFMDFLKADRESCCQSMITNLFRTRRAAGSIDPALIILLQKTNRMKKLKVKKLQRAGKCVRRKKVSKQEEMEMLMALVDLKVVERVLRMWGLTRQQLRWCEQKMTKLTLSKTGHLHRDSSPLFFPLHSNPLFPVRA